MLTLLVVKEKLRLFYSKYAIICNILFKFALTFTCLLVINHNMPYIEALQNIFLLLIISLICSILPFSAIAMLLAIYALSNIYMVSIEMTIIVSVFLLVVSILYYGFGAKDAYLLIIIPLLFAAKMPYVVPLIVGLSAGLVSVIPVSCGVILFYLFAYTSQNAGVLINGSAIDIAQRYTQMLNAFISNKPMLMMIIAFAAAICAIHIIKSFSFDYSRVVALAVGVVILLTVIFLGNFMFDIVIPIGEIIAGVVLSGFIAYIYNFFTFSVDYTRTEYTQFEDDDYYYYVKAVPKLTVKASEKKIQTYTQNSQAPQEKKSNRKTY